MAFIKDSKKILFKVRVTKMRFVVGERDEFNSEYKKEKWEFIAKGPCGGWWMENH